MDYQTNKWHGCYDDSWQGIIVPEAFAHPAKMAYGLTRRIIKHALSESWIKPGDFVVDPFGGIGSTGLVGACFGLKVVCVELESEFYRMANSYECPGISKKEWVQWYNRFRKNPDICPECHNKAQGWYEKNSGIIPFLEPHHYIGNFEKNAKIFDMYWGKPVHPVIIQGDSRCLSELISGCDVVVGSPPYAGQDTNIFATKNQGKRTCDYTDEEKAARKQGAMGRNGFRNIANATPGQLGAMKPGIIDAVVSSPPFADTLKGDSTQSETAAESRAKRRTNGGSLGQSQRTKGYGSKGNLGNLRPGCLKPGEVSAVIGSPPFRGAHSGTTDKSSLKPPHDSKDNMQTGYGNSHGNIAALKPGEVDAVVSSPPYEGSNTGQKPGTGEDVAKKRYERLKKAGYDADALMTPGRRKHNLGTLEHYGNSEGQLGQEKGQTFWQAAKIIVSECHKILKPGGYAIWVVKSFVRNKKKVDFPGDWRKLCESAGFETLHEHHAIMLKERKLPSLFGDIIIERKKRNSFFRKLGESKAAYRNYWKTIDKTEQKTWVKDAENFLRKENKGKITKFKILSTAQNGAFLQSGEDEHAWNEDVRIDYEVVLCMRRAE
jgi:hypothetical protein